jgi:AcrR family transcriptional regulator
MPRTEEQFEEMRQKRRQEIMKTALELFAEQGYHNTSISKIAKTAGVSKGLMYNYFESKEALLDAIIFGAAAASSEVFDENIFAAIPPKKRLELIIEGAFVMVKMNLKHWKLLTMLAFQGSLFETFKQKVDEKKKQALESFIQLFEELGVEKPKHQAFLVAAAIDGALMQYMYLEDEYPLDEMKDYIIKQFCD